MTAWFSLVSSAIESLLSCCFNQQARQKIELPDKLLGHIPGQPKPVQFSLYSFTKNRVVNHEGGSTEQQAARRPSMCCVQELLSDSSAWSVPGLGENSGR